MVVPCSTSLLDQRKGRSRIWEARNVKRGGELMWMDLLMLDANDVNFRKQLAYDLVSVSLELEAAMDFVPHESSILRHIHKVSGEVNITRGALWVKTKPIGGEEAHGMSTGGAATNRRFSVGAAMHQTPKLKRKHISVTSMELLSTGRRGLDVARLLSKKQSMNLSEQLQSPLVR
ncbi:hypothetical protein Bca4012_025273 [Brassica carinata]